MSGATNGIVGSDYPTELPETQIDDSQLKEIQAAAAFAKSPQFEELKRHLNTRIEFYQQYLPDGRAVGAQPINEETTMMWVASNVIIGECKAIISSYEAAFDLVKDGTTRPENA